MKIVLASNSPRRKELLKTIVEKFDVITSQLDESTIKIKSPKKLVSKLAKCKCRTVYDNLTGERCVIGADTVVSFNNTILGKPKNEEHAREMLSLLSGKSHHVYTGVNVIIYKQGFETEYNFVCSTVVTFNNLSQEEIANYIATKEPMDKAGAYAVQGLAGKFVKKINGCFTNIVGLPTAQLYEVLKQEDLV